MSRSRLFLPLQRRPPTILLLPRAPRRPDEGPCLCFCSGNYKLQITNYKWPMPCHPERSGEQREPLQSKDPYPVHNLNSLVILRPSFWPKYPEDAKKQQRGRMFTPSYALRVKCIDEATGDWRPETSDQHRSWVQHGVQPRVGLCSRLPGFSRWGKRPEDGL